MYHDTSIWWRILDLMQGGLPTILFISMPLSYPLLLGLVFMRFHHKVEADLVPLMNERIKLSLVYKILTAAELVGSTDSKENLVLETFFLLRAATLGKSEQTDQSKNDVIAVKQQELSGESPLEAIAKILVNVAGALQKAS